MEEDKEDNDADDDDEDDTAPLCPSLMIVIGDDADCICLHFQCLPSTPFHPFLALFPFKSSVDREAPSVLSQTSSCTK